MVTTVLWVEIDGMVCSPDENGAETSFEESVGFQFRQNEVKINPCNLLQIPRADTHFTCSQIQYHRTGWQGQAKCKLYITAWMNLESSSYGYR